MKSVLSLSLAVVVSLAVLSGCTRQSEPSEPASVEVTNVTDVTTATTPPASAAGAAAVESEDVGTRRASQNGASEGSLTPVSLNLSLPSEAGSNDDSYLFAEKEQAPNYFQSKSEQPGVKFKGKVYMIEEPTSEKRMENVDGGEIGIVVPLK